jgi:hypothetical protein
MVVVSEAPGALEVPEVPEVLLTDKAKEAKEAMVLEVARAANPG